MALGTLIDTTFKNVQEEDCTILVEKEGYAGTVFSPGVQGYDVKPGNQDDTISIQRRVSMLGVAQIVADSTALVQALKGISQGGLRNYRLTITRAGSTRFTGWCVPQATTTRVNENRTQVATIRAKDRLRGLGGDWVQAGGGRFTGTRTLASIISGILSDLSLSLPIEVVMNWRPETLTGADDPLSIVLPTDAFYRSDSGDNVRAMTKGQVLDHCLLAMGASMVQSEGAWKIHQPAAFESGATVDVWNYNAAGVFQSQTTRSASVSITNASWLEGSGEVGAVPLVREARVTYEHGAPAALDINGSFEERSGARPTGWDTYENGVLTNNYGDGTPFGDAPSDKVIDGDFGLQIADDQVAPGATNADFANIADDWAQREAGVVTTATEDLDLRLQATFVVTLFSGGNIQDARLFWAVLHEGDSGTDYYWVEGTGWADASTLSPVDYRNFIQLTITGNPPGDQIKDVDATKRLTPPPESGITHVQVHRTISEPADASSDNYLIFANWDALELERAAGTEQPSTTYRVYDASAEEGKRLDYTIRVGDGPWADSLGAMEDGSNNLTGAWSVLGEAGDFFHSELIAREAIRLRRASRPTIRLTLVRPSVTPLPDRALEYDGTRYWPLALSESSPNDEVVIYVQELARGAAPSGFEILPGDGETISSETASGGSGSATSGSTTTITGVESWNGRKGAVTLLSADVTDVLSNTNGLTADMLAPDSVGASEIIDGSVGAAEIATDAVTNTEIDNTIALTVATLDTGQGANELYPMNQGVRTSDAVAFLTVTANNFLFNQKVESDLFAPRQAGAQITGAGVADLRKLYVDELVAKVFTADLTQALAGSDFLTKSVTTLAADFTVPTQGNTATLTVHDLPGQKGAAAFAAGDWIRLRVVDNSGGGLVIVDAWGTVVSYVDNTDGTQDWTFTRKDADADADGKTVGQNAAALDYGQAGDAVIRRSVEGGTPLNDIRTWETDPMSAANYSTLVFHGDLSAYAGDAFSGLTGAGAVLEDNIYIGESAVIGGRILHTGLFTPEPEELLPFEQGLTGALNEATPNGYSGSSRTDYGYITGTGLKVLLPFGAEGVEWGRDATNVQENPSFENGTTDWGTLGTPTTLAVVPGRWGSVLKVVGTTGDGVNNLFQTEVDAGETWTLSLWLKSNCDVQVRHRFRDSSNNVLSDAQQTFGPSETWRRVSLTATAPTNTVKSNITITAATAEAPSRFWVDDVQIEQNDYATPFVVGSRSGFQDAVLTYDLGFDTEWAITFFWETLCDEYNPEDGVRNVLMELGEGSNQIVLESTSVGNLHVKDGVGGTQLESLTSSPNGYFTLRMQGQTLTIWEGTTQTHQSDIGKDVPLTRFRLNAYKSQRLSRVAIFPTISPSDIEQIVQAGTPISPTPSRTIIEGGNVSVETLSALTVNTGQLTVSNTLTMGANGEITNSNENFSVDDAGFATVATTTSFLPDTSFKVVDSGGNIVAALWGSSNNNASLESRVNEVFTVGQAFDDTGLRVIGGAFIQFNAAGAIIIDPSTGEAVSVQGSLNVSGALDVTGSKNFLIDHPTKTDYWLRHSSLEGPEAGVYHRGRLTGRTTIDLPDYWRGLVRISTITVDLTPNDHWQNLYVADVTPEKIAVQIKNGRPEDIDCFYVVRAERKDIDSILVEERKSVTNS